MPASKPFLLLQLRPEAEASDNEYEAILKRSGLDAGQVRRIRLERENLPSDLKLDDHAGVIVGGGPGCVSDPEHLKSPVEKRIEQSVMALMPEITARDFPFLGCCYGIGILGHHLGGEVSKERYSEPVSVTRGSIEPDGRDDALLRERRRQEVLAGGYRLSAHHPSHDQVTLVGVGAIMPEVCAAAERLESLGVRAGVVCLTSPSLVFRALREQDRVAASPRSGILDRLFPTAHPAPLVTVVDAHPHTLAFLAGARGDRIRTLGVTAFGQGASVSDAYRLHGIDADAIASAALDISSHSIRSNA